MKLPKIKVREENRRKLVATRIAFNILMTTIIGNFSPVFINWALQNFDIYMANWLIMCWGGLVVFIITMGNIWLGSEREMPKEYKQDIKSDIDKASKDAKEANQAGVNNLEENPLKPKEISEETLRKELDLTPMTDENLNTKLFNDMENFENGEETSDEEEYEAYEQVDKTI